MKIAYFDCFAGASGDMILGALMDAGLPLEHLKRALAKLHLNDYEIQVRDVAKQGIQGSQAIVIVNEGHHHHRNFYHIKEIIEKSDLSKSVKQKSINIFTRLAEAEARVHRSDIENIHFHEIGAMDAIIDIVGAVAGFELLGIEKIYSSSLHVGTGTVKCAHGILPVPAPATLELIRDKPIYSTGVEGELLTPTGAAILTTLSSDFCSMPPMRVEQIGYGAGTSERSIPNLLRISIGETFENIKGYETDQIAVIETSIDDMNPQCYEYLMEKVLEMGAMDIFLSPLQMKKNRPATLLTILCKPELVEKFSEFLIQETTSIGLRWRIDNRIKAKRAIRKIETKYGIIQFKIAEISNRIINISPEYEDCKKIAIAKNIPLKTVMEQARLEGISKISGNAVEE